MGKTESFFFEEDDGVLNRRHEWIPELEKIVVHKTLRARLLQSAHHLNMDGNPGRTRMSSDLRHDYYWPLMATDITSVDRSCPHCACNSLRVISRKQPMRLLPTKQPLESVAVDRLGLLPKLKVGNCFILVMADRFTKLTKVVAMKRKTGLDVDKSFYLNWVFN